MDSTRIHGIFVIAQGVRRRGISCGAGGRSFGFMLAELQDVAGRSLAAATKLIHGGVRHLKRRGCKLQNEALAESEVLEDAAPHIVWPLRLVPPFRKGTRAIISSDMPLQHAMRAQLGDTILIAELGLFFIARGVLSDREQKLA